MERYEQVLTSGKTLHTLQNEEEFYGHFVVEPDGRVRVWRQTWVDTYSPTDTVFPGPISAMRAMRRGEA